MKSIFETQRSQANLQRNAFDLSENHIFSASPGMLLPFFFKECNPNEHFEINPQSFVRTMPLNTAAFTRLTQFVDFYFVPYSVLCRQFSQFVVGTEYNTSSIMQLNSYKANLPALNLIELTNVLSNSATQKDDLGFPLVDGTIRLLDLCGYGIANKEMYDKLHVTDDNDLLNVNPFRLLAYQKVYQDYFRNPDYELADPLSYNIDSTFGKAKLTPNIGMAKLRYRNWKKDYLTAIKPYFQGTDYLTKSTEVPQFWLELNRGKQFYPTTDKSLETAGRLGNAQAILTYSGLNSGETPVLSVANLRAAYALDKLYRLTINAGDGDYASQIRAHYGFNVRNDSDKSVYLGGVNSPIQISEVITTANTTNDTGAQIGVTGDVYGKASGANVPQNISYDTNEHGVIIGLFSVVPDLDYNSFMIDEANKKFAREDYFQPEFADLGMQPITTYAFDIRNMLGASVAPSYALGFVNRYMEYKTAINKVHGSFAASGSLSAWSAPRNGYDILFDNKTFLGVRFPYFKVIPNILDSIMSISYDGTQNTDCFLVDCSVRCSAIRPMSLTGEPAL
ncbi:MAG: major capsid protein [Microviridae sp.]|nr:MAG: major capsid protein [Microviridae sp.]AXQ65574.1 MAG: major capsid protein [Microviridae sp.]